MTPNGPTAFDLLREFVDDCERAYRAGEGEALDSPEECAANIETEGDWPDLAPTYLKARAFLDATPAPASSLRDLLKTRFPWLGTEEDAQGAETVDALAALYDELNKGTPAPIPPRVQIDVRGGVASYAVSGNVDVILADHDSQEEEE